MGGVYSSRLDDRQRRYLRGRTDAVLRSFMPYYRRQVASVVFQHVQGELEPPEKHGLQLLQYKVFKDPEIVLQEGFLFQYDDKSQKWRESYVTVRGDFTLEWFRYREVQGKDCKPQGRTVLTGYQLAVSLGEYSCLVESICQELLGAPSHQVKGALRCPPTEFSLFLFHPYRQHLCLCLTSAEALGSWRAVLRDGIRWFNTAQQRGDRVTTEAFMEAVRFYRQGKGSYGASDHLLGNKTELMQNLVFTFQHLSNLHLKQINSTPDVIQTLEKVRGRIFKKFDYDSSAIRKQFAQDALVQIFLPFLLQRLESSCKLELPKYESYVFADYSSVVSVESVYEEIVLGLLQKVVDKGLREASNQNKHNLYSDSFASVFSSTEDCRPSAERHLGSSDRCWDVGERNQEGHGVRESSGSEGNPGASGDAQSRESANTLKCNRVLAGLWDLETGFQTGVCRADGKGMALPGSREQGGQSAVAVTMSNGELSCHTAQGLRKYAWPTCENLHVVREAEEMEVAERQLLLDGLSLAMEMAVFQMDRDLMEMDRTEQRKEAAAGE